MHDQLDPADDDRGGDDEVFIVEPPVLGGPVDPPDLPITWADLTVRGEQRRPIIPAWLRSHTQRVQVLRWMVGYALYVAGYHASRLPKYGVKVAWWAPVGLLRTSWRLLKWATAEEGNWALRQHAATRGDAKTWLDLDRQRQNSSRWRWWVVAAIAFIVLAAVVATRVWAPYWAQVAAVTVLLPVLAVVGRPADKPITDRVVQGQRFTKLTGEMVRLALCSLGIAGIKDPGSISFPPPGIHRDGPGWLARIDLPHGVEAVDVMERRGKLSSGLRLPIDQVWPTAGPGHAGQLDLWVGYMPASAMGQPKWSLLSVDRTSIFDKNEFGTDERQRPVQTVLFERNFLIGGVPGSGKSYAARTLALIAALDPACELKIAEFKGTADFGDLAHLCSTYVCGVDDQALDEGAAIIAWGLAEAERRGRRIRAARERGEAPEGKVTPELAHRPGSGLHSVFILIDEAHELLVDKDVAKACERLIKRGRALGLIVALSTQIPDKESVPPAITRCVNMRWCLAVQDHYANDMILGTGAYKRGLAATVYRPELDAGWGIMTGLAAPLGVRSHYPSPDEGAHLVARATALRGGQVVGDGAVAPMADLLDDVVRVWSYVGRPGVTWQQLAELLATNRPEVYAGITAEAVSTLMRDKGVPSVNVRHDGQVLKGCQRDAVDAAVQRRELGAG